MIAGVDARTDFEVFRQDDPDTVVASGSADPGADGELLLNLPYGAYVVRFGSSMSKQVDVTLVGETLRVLERLPEPGSDKNSAQDLGLLSEVPVEVGGYVGNLDAEDYYMFELENPSSLSVIMADMAGRIFVHLYQNAAVIDETAPFASLDSTSTSLTINLPRGVYYARMVVRSGGTHNLYSTTFMATEYSTVEGSPEAGGDKEGAIDLGVLSESPVKVGGYVGSLDTEDYYMFELEYPSTLSVIAADMAGRVYVHLYQDAAVIDETAPFASLDSANTSLTINLPRGVYYARMAVRSGGTHNLYSTTFMATEYSTVEGSPEAGGDKEGAIELGVLSESPVKVGGYVGNLDAEDYYMFELENPSTLSVITADMAGRIFVHLYQDAVIIDETAPFASLDSANTSLSQSLSAGTYYARVVVRTNGTNNLYSASFGAAVQ